MPEQRCCRRRTNDRPDAGTGVAWLIGVPMTLRYLPEPNGQELETVSRDPALAGAA
jgi:hypothetical protein